VKYRLISRPLRDFEVYVNASGRWVLAFRARSVSQAKLVNTLRWFRGWKDGLDFRIEPSSDSRPAGDRPIGSPRADTERAPEEAG